MFASPFFNMISSHMSRKDASRAAGRIATNRPFYRSSSSRPKPYVKLKRSIKVTNCWGSEESLDSDVNLPEIMPPSHAMFRRSNPVQHKKRRSTHSHIDPDLLVTRNPDVELGYCCTLNPLCGELPEAHDPTSRNSAYSYISQNHDLSETIVINVGGKRYETLLTTLNRYPESLLGDPQKRSRHLNVVTREYFFDRNRFCFDTILELYRTGEGLCRPSHVPIQTFVRELFFYELGDEVIHDFLESEGLLRDRVVVPKHPVQRRIWRMFETTDSSIIARIIAITNVILVLTAIVIFCIQTLPEFQTKDIFVNGTMAYNVDSWGENNMSNPFFIVETICTLWFILDLVIRFLVSPVRNRFFFNVMNIIDILSILPYFIDLALNTPQTQIIGEPSKVMLLTILRILRVIKIFRVFKLGRYSNGLQTLAMTLKAARYEVGLMLVVVAIGVIVFSAAVYYAEMGSGSTQFKSIPGGFWWAIITWTTVGYGDVVPQSVAGQIVGGFCALCGILGLSFMVPVIVAHFEHFFYRKCYKILRSVGAMCFSVESPSISALKNHHFCSRKFCTKKQASSCMQFPDICLLSVLSGWSRKLA